METHLFKPGKRSARFCTQCGLGQKHSIHHTLPPPVQEQVIKAYPHVQPGLSLSIERELTMLDLNGNEIVEVQICANPVGGGETLWVNVDGICRLRAVRPGQIVINDERKRK